MARPKSHGSPKDSSAHLGFEATARRDRANPKGEAIPRSLEGNLWLSADTALRDSAFLQRKASPQVVSEATNNSGL